MEFRKKILVLACVGFIFPAALAAPPALPAPVPTPDEEKAQFTVADGFEVNLFAADPAIDKPIEMNFDPAGRMWLVSSETYPQIKPGDTANDKVIVLEDDGSGRAKQAKVFVDHLLIPTGIAYGDGGVYVANSTELLFFKEKPDGTAGDRRVVLSGFGTEDTHHILHTLRWGPDGRLYFNQSVYIHSHIETPWGVRNLNSGGIWRFEPSSMRLDVFIKGLWNPWGQSWEDYGQSLGTDGAGGEGVNFNVPGAMYPAYAGATKILHGLNPGSPKYAGCEIVSGRALPPDWQGLLLTNDFRASRVCRFQLSDDGSGFAAKQLSDLIKSKTNVFRPIDIKLGPDGAIYIADWCNPIINHGEVDFRDPRRDHSHGRIWRVTFKGLPPVEKPRLVGASIDQLLEQLKSPEGYTRQQAKRVLAESDPKAVAAALPAFISSLKADDPRFEHQKLEALWVYESIDTVEPKLLEALLAAKDARVRAAAVRTLSHWHELLPTGRDLLAKAIVDEHPRVRLEAIRALADYPSAESFRLALSALDQPRDRFIDYALWLTATDLQKEWEPALADGTLKLPPAKAAFALAAIGSKEALKPLLAGLQSGKLSAEDRASLMGVIAESGSPQDLSAVLTLAVSAGLPAPLRVELLGAMDEAAKQGKTPPAVELAALKPLFTADDGTRAAAIRLAGTAKVEPLRQPMLDAAVAPETSETTRRAAIDALSRLGGKKSIESLTTLCDAKHPQAVRFMAAAALIPLNGRTAATQAAEALAAPPQADPTLLFNAFLKARGGDTDLATALRGKKIPPDAAKLGVRAIYQASRPDSPLLAALTEAGGIAAAARELTKEQMTALVAEIPVKGDPARGEAIFRRKELACLQCHAIAGSGGIVAPDLLSLGASAPVDYIIDSLLLPNKAIKEGYNSVIVTTKSGDQFTGIKVRQNEKELVLKDALHDAIAIPVGDIKSMRDGGSIMPAGLTDMLTHAEFVDLIRFLSELGKGPYAAAGMPVARRWRVVDPPVGNGGSVTPEQLDGLPAASWVAIYSQVNGVLPVASFQGQGRATVRTQLEVSTPGKIQLKVNDPAGIMLVWFDNQLVDANATISIDATQGVHSLTFNIEHWRRTEGLKVELVEVPGSAAKAQFVAGK